MNYVEIKDVLVLVHQHVLIVLKLPIWLILFVQPAQLTVMIVLPQLPVLPAKMDII
jgi:hypothetical protein